MKINIRKLLDYLLPLCCDLCRRQISQGRLCQTCQATLVKTTPCCTTCQASLAVNATCGECINLKPSFEKVYSLGDYQGGLIDLITGLKFHGKLNHGRALSALWIQALPDLYRAEQLPSLIIPIPLHPRRLRERGFNQSLEIAKPIGKHFKIPVDKFTCLRIKATATQTSLPQKMRKHNLANAFVIRTSITAHHVAIIDDVFTSGHTVNTLAILLKKQGVKRIDVWCCARTQWQR